MWASNGGAGQPAELESDVVRIAVLGTGNVGRALGCRWADAGHEVFFGARDPQCDEVAGVIARAGRSARVGTCGDAIDASEAILLAVPWDQTRSVLEQAGSLDGKIVMDCINPLLPDLSGLELGFSTSAAEQIAEWFPQTRVVKAFNTLSAATMEDPQYGDEQACMFYCGDDVPAKATVKQLAEDLGFAPIDCGPLRLARQLEPFAMPYVHLAVFEGWGGDCAFKILRR
jgi:NADPH-dependent F420 reductase